MVVIRRKYLWDVNEFHDKLVSINDLMLEDLMKIYEEIALGRDKVMVNWWRCEDMEIIKLEVCVEFAFHMKIKKLEDLCS